MIKRTLYFGNPAYISLSNSQLKIKLPGVSESGLSEELTQKTVPIEDIGVVVLDHRQITVTTGALEALLANNSAVVTCDSARMPTGLLLPLNGNTTQNERFRAQLDASLPLQKQLWQQTVQAKIANQAAHLQAARRAETRNMQKWVQEVKSGDADNLEARAAAYYWPALFEDFRRDRAGDPPNNLLNYGYAILRAITARALVGSGLLPTLGIHHHNRYNAYCLADDIMEPYRPYVDRIVAALHEAGTRELDQAAKTKLLGLSVEEVVIGGSRSPLMTAVAQTTASLYKCFSGQARRIAYPEM